MPPPDQQARNRLIVALDMPSATQALALVDHLDHAVLWYKVGLELYLAEGAPIVHALKQRGKNVFLDLKLHDIPNTVAAATRVAARTGADLLTLHAGGGPTMLRAAVAAAEASPLKLLAVTVLTSMDVAELNAAGVPSSPGSQVETLAAMALSTGVHGLVCSPLESASLRHKHGPAPLLVVPGIRNPADASGDQQRVANPAEAIHNGASMLVVGRPVTRAAHPAAEVASILQQIGSATAANDSSPLQG